MNLKKNYMIILLIILNKKNKIINEGINRVDKLNDKYFDIDKLNNKHNINMIKEKLKLDVIKSLNSFVLK